jgi:hypothetical protein
MRIIKIVQLGACAVILSSILAIGAKADDWSRKTIVTFSRSVEIPGKVLPAGTYVFKLADSIADRELVEVWDGHETRLLATLRTIPEQREEIPNETIFNFDERPGDSPMAIRAWFFPGQDIGQEFVYPQS